MWKGGVTVFRNLCRRQRIIENRISSHCLSTTVPPPSSRTSTPVGASIATPVSANSSEKPTTPGGTNFAANRRSTHNSASDTTGAQLPGWDADEYSCRSTTGAAGCGPVTDTDARDEQWARYDVNALYGSDDGISTLPCIKKRALSGPEPEYNTTLSGFQIYHHVEPFELRYGGVLPELSMAYETWGELNEAKDNVVLVSAGLSAASHARSHECNDQVGWWEKFIGAGCAIDTNKYFVICANNLGSCFGSTGPSSMNPSTGKSYGSDFPMISIDDMVRAQFLVLDHLKIDKVYSAVGASLGGMLSLTSSVLYPERIGRVVSISAAVSSHPTSIAMRYLQRKAIMSDPDWNYGHYYNTGRYPKSGMKLAREIATLTYRSGPEWEERFDRKRIDDKAKPGLCPSFLIESYLDYQGESSCMKLDPNSLLYVSKAMDLFDLGEMFGTLDDALRKVVCPVMVIGVQTDLLFPVWQQREMAKALQRSGNHAVTYYELNSIYGHDTFLLDLNGVGAGIKGFLETELREKGRVRPRKDRVENP